MDIQNRILNGSVHIGPVFHDFLIGSNIYIKRRFSYHVLVVFGNRNKREVHRVRGLGTTQSGPIF